MTETTSTAPGAHPDRLPALSAFSLPTALVVTQDGQVIARAGDVDAVHPLASVTKPLVVWSALVAVDRGLLALDDPASPGLPGATIAHLMSHSSGVAFDSPAVLAAPGTRRVYSNFGIEILGQRLQEATATPLEAWVETTVLEITKIGRASCRERV